MAVAAVWVPTKIDEMTDLTDDPAATLARLGRRRAAAE